MSVDILNNVFISDIRDEAEFLNAINVIAAEVIFQLTRNLSFANTVRYIVQFFQEKADNHTIFFNRAAMLAYLSRSIQTNSAQYSGPAVIGASE